MRYYHVGNGIGQNNLKFPAKENFVWDCVCGIFRNRLQISTYAFRLSQANTTPMEAPSVLGTSQKMYVLILFRLLQMKGGAGGGSIGVVRD